MKRLAALAAAALLASLFGVGSAARRLWTQADAGGEPRVFEVAPGEPLSRVAERLDAAGLLPEGPLFGPRVLVLYARARGLDRRVKSGEYDLSPSMTPVAILHKIVSGEVKTYPVTVPEGLHIDEVAARLETAGVVPAAELAAHARDPAFARELGLEAESLEGYLYPETYRFRRDTPAREALRRMVEEFRAAWSEADRARLAESELDLHDVVTLASIVEKETGVPEERPRIAAVFLNRLERGMRLQSDPTVIYGLLVTRGAFDGNLRRRDLETDMPYNTYTRAGLPPGPIASASMDAIRAVLEPGDVPYLYFVSKNDGTHHFSETLVEHNAAVERYQRGG